MERYKRMSYANQNFEIHWLSIINSFILVLLLTGFLAMILMRVLRNDLNRYMTEGDDDEEESGWKLINHDVFRFPKNNSLFAAMIGTGTQLFALIFSLLFLAVVGYSYHLKRGSLYTMAIVFYALVSGLGGYVSAIFYKKLDGTKWVWNVVLAATLFAGPFFAVASFLNTVAALNGGQNALPIGTVILIILIWALVSFPLTVFGAIAGRNHAVPFDAPCRTKNIPREIPAAKWYRMGPVHVFMSGFLPFSAIYIELHYIFASMWGHKLYTLYGILLLAFILLIVVTSFITIAMTYFQLTVEDHRWWWRSFFSGGSTGFFIYAYCFFYYYNRSDMNGFWQTSFFFGYMLIVAYAFFLMLGTVGFISSLVFVKKIYGAIKSD
eukprot:GFYU01009336.1.p1 GENE.GFYU01009336.1~~GFYU01009336.1.p1  ORF type:complete len:380 (+),score=104.43 GFYU01009336.1:3-1142(+)